MTGEGSGSGSRQGLFSKGKGRAWGNLNGSPRAPTGRSSKLDRDWRPAKLTQLERSGKLRAPLQAPGRAVGRRVGNRLGGVGLLGSAWGRARAGDGRALWSEVPSPAEGVENRIGCGPCHLGVDSPPAGLTAGGVLTYAVFCVVCGLCRPGVSVDLPLRRRKANCD